MRRHKKILEYTLSSLLRRRYRNMAVMVIYTLMIAIISSVLFLTHAFKMEAVGLLAEAPELIVQKVSGGRHDLISTEYMDEIMTIPGVGRVIPRYWGYYFNTSTDANYTLMGVGAETDGIELIDGRMPSGDGECAIGRGVADATYTKAKVGWKMYLFDSERKVRKYEVTGIFSSSSSLLTNDLVILTRDEIRKLFTIPPDRATDIVVQVHNPSEIPNIAGKIRVNLPDTRPIMRDEILQTYETLFSWRSGMMLTLFLGALLAFCILAWDKATGLSAEEKREIGILKAIGWETSDVLEMKFWEGAVISLTSFLTGTILAYVHIFFFNASFITPMLKGWSVLFPAFHLRPYINPYQVFIIFFMTVIPYIASTIIPSWKSAITDPDEVMRG